MSPDLPLKKSGVSTRAFLIVLTILGFSFFPTLIGAADTEGRFSLTSPVFHDGEAIPEAYTCKGADINPPLEISNPPVGVHEFVLTVREPDNPIGPWSHWLVFHISPATRMIAQNSGPGTQALNDFGNFYYGGPCVFDAKPHHFVFTVFALNDLLDNVNEGSTLDVLEKAMRGKVIGKAQLIGTYRNPLWGQDDPPL